MPAIVTICFDHTWDDETLHRRAKQFSAEVKPEIPGLVWKIFTKSSEPRQSSGIYLFDTLAAAEAYAVGERVIGMRNSEDISNVSVSVAAVMEEESILAGAPL